MANRRFIDFPIATTVGDNDIVLIWQDGANKQTTKATILSGLPENLEDLNDVVISGLTNGQILRYDSVTGKWENTDQGNLDLNDLNDVSIVSPSNGQVLVYNSSTSKWENSSGGFVPYTGAVTTVNLGAQTIQAGQFVKAGGTSSQFLKADGSIDSTAYGTGSVTSVGLTMPSAFSVANSPITTAGTLAVTGAGTVGQYIRGDGSLADFPQASGGGSSVSYYLNGSVNQGTIGGVDYRELSKVPILGAGTQFSINANGYIAQFLTDAGDPNLLEIPGGNWNFETYFSASSGGGTPTFYVELYKYDGTTFTLIASSSTSPEFIAFGTNLTPYYSTLAVPTTTLALTDRLAVRYYVTHSGRTITMHTENNTLCQIVTTFTTGLTSLNGLTAQVQNLAVGTSGTDFNIASATATHTFNLPTASATNRGALSSADWTTFNNKQNAGNYVTTDTSQLISGLKTFNVNTLMMQSSGNANAVYLSNSSGSSTYQSGFNFFGFNTDNHIYFAKSSITGGNTGILAWTNTATRTYTLKDASGTLAFTSDIPANPVGGTGTTNYLPKFTGSTTIGNSLVFDNGTNLGINTNTPNDFIDGERGMAILQSTNGRAVLSLVGTRTDANEALGRISFTNSNSTNIGSKRVSYISGVRGSTNNSAYLEFAVANDALGSPQMVLSQLGNLLIGSSNQSSDNGARLQVSGGNVTITNSGNVFSTIKTTTNTGVASYLCQNDINTTTEIGAWGSTRSGFGAIQPNNGYIFSGDELAIGASLALKFGVGGSNTERMRITSSGNVGIGTSSPDSQLTLNGSSNSRLNMRAGDTRYGTLYADNGVFAVASITAIPLVLGTNDIERMRITSGGFTKASNTGSYSAGGGSLHEFNTNQNDTNVAFFNTASTLNAARAGIDVLYVNTAPNNTTAAFYQAADNAGGRTLRFEVRSNGGIANFSANNVALSDIRTKKNILPLESYWEKFKALEIVKFKYKDQTHDDFNIGVIAQQVEKVAPEFVDVDGWDGIAKTKDVEPLKSIYTADLYNASIKVLQEALLKIEKLEAEIYLLKN